MSVVVAIKENGKVTIGADSQCTRGGTRRTLSNPNNYKVWRVLDAENCIMRADEYEPGEGLYNMDTLKVY